MGTQLATDIDTDTIEDLPILPSIIADPPIHPIHAGPVPNKVVHWSGESKVPKSVQWLLAGCWIGILGLLPLVYSIVDSKPMTKTQKAVGAVMMVTVFGGFWLFTNVIYFQSPHFDRIRPLTIVECIYMMAQVITTVGYGDVTPAKPRGQVFVGLYVLGALFVIAMIISDLTAHVILVARAYRERVHAQRAQADQAGTEARRQESIEQLIKPSPP